MRILFHGDHQSRSREAYRSQLSFLQSPSVETIHLDGTKVDLNQVVQATESASLISSQKLVVIERLHQLTSKALLSSIIDQLVKYTPESTFLLMWEGKELTKHQLTKLLGFDIREFKLPPIIFQFLDSLKPHQSRNNLNMLTKALQVETPEVVFYYLAGRLRDLISYPENRQHSPWRKEKLATQSRRFDPSHLTDIHSKLTQTDYRFKTGLLPLDLKSELEMITSAI